MLDIPPDFQRDVLAGRQPSVQLNVDATRMSQAFIGSSYIRNIVTGEVTAFSQRYRTLPVRLAELEIRVRFNPNLSSVWFGSVMEVINSITMILTGAALIREREHGTIEHLLVMAADTHRDHVGQSLVDGPGNRHRGYCLDCLCRAGFA